MPPFTTAGVFKTGLAVERERETRKKGMSLQLRNRLYNQCKQRWSAQVTISFSQDINWWQQLSLTAGFIPWHWYTSFCISFPSNGADGSVSAAVWNPQEVRLYSWRDDSVLSKTLHLYMIHEMKRKHPVDRWDAEIQTWKLWFHLSWAVSKSVGNGCLFCRTNNVTELMSEIIQSFVLYCFCACVAEAELCLNFITWQRQF